MQRRLVHSSKEISLFAKAAPSDPIIPIVRVGEGRAAVVKEKRQLLEIGGLGEGTEVKESEGDELMAVWDATLLILVAVATAATTGDRTTPSQLARNPSLQLLSPAKTRMRSLRARRALISLDLSRATAQGCRVRAIRSSIYQATTALLIVPDAAF